MFILLQTLYDKFTTIMYTLFETFTFRTPPDYEKLPEDENEIKYFENPIRRNLKDDFNFCV